MSTMLILLTIVCAILGLINPKLIGLKNLSRVKACLLFIVLAIVISIITTGINSAKKAGTAAVVSKNKAISEKSSNKDTAKAIKDYAKAAQEVAKAAKMIQTNEKVKTDASSSPMPVVSDVQPKPKSEIIETPPKSQSDDKLTVSKPPTGGQTDNKSKADVSMKSKPAVSGKYEQKMTDDSTKSESKSIVYRGNTSSKVLHKKGCKTFNCKNCTAKFDSRDEAIKAGYKPCEKCRP